jgi:hypothetical protein
MVILKGGKQMDDNKEGWVKFRRGAMEHLPKMSDNAWKIFSYMLFRAEFKGEDVGTLCMTQDDLGTYLKKSRSTIKRGLKELKPHYINYEESHDHTRPMKYTVVKYDLSCEPSYDLSCGLSCGLSSPSNQPKVVEKKEPKNIRTKEVKKYIYERFEEFWEAYGKKVGKEPCLEWYLKHSNESLHSKILEGIKIWRESGRWKNPKYQLDPIRFLKRKAWEDEPPRQYEEKKKTKEDFEDADLDRIRRS